MTVSTSGVCISLIRINVFGYSDHVVAAHLPAAVDQHACLEHGGHLPGAVDHVLADRAVVVGVGLDRSFSSLKLMERFGACSGAILAVELGDLDRDEEPPRPSLYPARFQRNQPIEIR